MPLRSGWSLAALLTALLGAILIAYVSERTPAPLSVNAAPTLFSAGRALLDLREIAREPRPTGSAANALSRQYLKHKLEQLGLAVEYQDVPVSEKARTILKSWGAPYADSVAATNVIGVLPGRNRGQPAVGLMAHYDTVWDSPGAADDGAGVVAALEIARAIAAGGTPERDLVVILTDAEELGLDGAHGFFKQHLLAKRLGVVVNMEARGGGGRALMFETGNDNGAMMELFRREVANPSTNSLEVFIYKVLPNDTDYSVPKQLGIAGFNFAFLARSGLYHSPLATVQALDPGSLQHIGAQALDITRALVSAPKLPGKAPDRVFSDLFGKVVLAYSTWFGWVILGFAGACLGFAWLRVRLVTQVGWRKINSGITVTLWALVHTMLLLHLGNLVSGSAADDTNYYDRLAAIPRLEPQTALSCLAMLLAAAMAVRPRRRILAIIPACALSAASLLFTGFSPLGLITCGAGVVAALLSLMLPVVRPALWAGWFGAAVPIFIATLAMQITMPTGATLFAWTLVVAALAMALVAALDPELRRGVTLGLLTLLAAVVCGWFLIFGHLNFLALGASLPEVMAIFIVLLMLMLWPMLSDLRNSRVTVPLAVACVMVAVVLALWVRLDPLAPSVAPYSIKTHDKTASS